MGETCELTSKSRLERKAGEFFNWLRHDVDWALVFAAVVEVPRYAAAFLAIHEPLWVGVPLALLLAWSTKSAWEFYFERGWKKAKWVMVMNLVALAVAVFIITPVIYLMMSSPIQEIDMTTFNLWTAEPVQLAWAFAMSLCTFLPLMLVAAVKAGKKREANALQEDGSAQPEAATRDWVTTTPVASAGPVDSRASVDSIREPKTVKAKDAVLTVNGQVIELDAKRNGFSEPTSADKLEAWQMAQNGYTQKQIADKYSKTERTIRNWISEVEKYRE